jgi:hypothetical protein
VVDLQRLDIDGMSFWASDEMLAWWG